MTRKLLEPVDDGRCIACGPYSEFGLHMHFTDSEPGAVESRVTLAPGFQGWRGVAHGGVVAMLLDEAMAYAAASLNHLGVTADLRVRFRAPVPTGEELVVLGRVRGQRASVFEISAEIKDATGRVLAFGDGKFVSRGTLPPGVRLGRPDVR